MGLYIKACYGFTFKPKNKDYTEFNEWYEKNPEKVEEMEDNYYEMDDDLKFMIGDGFHYLTGLGFFNVYNEQFLQLGEEAFQISDDYKAFALEELKKAISEFEYDSFKDIENWECNINFRVSS